VAELSNELTIEMLRRMLRIRLFDEAAAGMQARGELPGPMHTSIGQEAEVVGACMALTDTDYMTGNHRSHGHPIGKGAALKPLMAELLGKATGVCRGHGGSMHLADFSVGSLGESGIVGAGIPIATGAALSSRLRGSGQVALAFFGDGAANCGPFHESLNLAAIWSLPIVFLCEDNGFAVTSRSTDMVSVQHISDRAVGYTVPGINVDGQDVLAVWRATTDAVERARAGEGPTLLDVKTYRYREHAEFGRVGDAVRTYRTQDEIAEWQLRDPILLFEKVLLKAETLDGDDVARLREEVQREVDEALEFARESPYPELDEAYENLFVEAVPAWH